MSQPAGYPKARVYAESYEVAEQLANLQLPRDLIVLATRKGHLERLLATPLDFAGRGEYDAASMALRTICEEGGKTPGGWHRETYLGIPVAFNNDESIAITVTGGDEYTGITGDRDPETRSLKGPATTRAVKEKIPFGRDPDVGVMLWYVLTFVENERKVRVEIASPRLGPEPSGRVTSWHERIIVGVIDFDGPEGTRATPPTPSAPTAPIVVDPVRRAS